MQEYLSFSLIFLVVIIVAVQVYFRIRLAKNFSLLKKHQIDLNLAQLFNDDYFENNIVKNHAGISEDLYQIRDRIKRALVISLICLLLIAVLSIYIYMTYNS